MRAPSPLPTGRDPDGYSWMDEPTREELRREARVVGLKDFDVPSLEAVERRRVQLWALSTVLLVVLSAAVLASLWWEPQVAGERVTQIVLRCSVLALTLAFAVYSFEKESHLRRLGHLLLDERLLTIALSNRLRELSLLLEAGKAMNSVLELPQVLTAILRSALELLRGSNGSIMLLDDSRTELHSVCSWGNEGARDARQPVGVGIAGTVASTGHPLLINGQAAPDDFPGLGDRHQPVHSAMCVPLVHHDQPMGVLNINADADRCFSEYDLRALSLFAEQAASTIVKARLFETQRAQAAQLAHLALHDPLTGVANRVLFLDHARQALDRARRNPAEVAVLFVDLDGFKSINDRLGHAAGDELLTEVAHRLGEVLRPTDTLARLGGDEFVVLCEGLSGEPEAVAVAARIGEAVAQPFALATGETRLTASIGIALAGGGSDDPEALLRDADTAMYRAKERGKACHEVFTATVRSQATSRLRTESLLRHAYEQDALTAAYEPIVELDGGALVAAEALLRFEADGGTVGLPEDLLDPARSGGLVVALSDWLLQEACHQAERWATRPAWRGPAAVYVKLSAAQLVSSSLFEDIQATLERRRLEPTNLHLAAGVAALSKVAPSTLQALEQLAAIGVRLGVDGYGRGLPAEALELLPLRFVKLHRSLVQGLLDRPEDRGAVEAALGAADALHLVTVADGVDNHGQAALLRDLGCRLAKGAHFGRPTSPFALGVSLPAAVDLHG